MVVVVVVRPSCNIVIWEWEVGTWAQRERILAALGGMERFWNRKSSASVDRHWPQRTLEAGEPGPTRTGSAMGRWSDGVTGRVDGVWERGRQEPHCAAPY